jgi:chromosome segregation ATPase|tara:strand:+ start:7491 stop:8039 length:549 start_codon:yes stop_codon:yes gene_type:complete
MSIPIIKFGLILLGFMSVNLANANDLITFGKACLVKEERLNQAKIKLDTLSRRSDQTQTKTNQAWLSLKQYQQEKGELETSMTECAETAPNSAYCHQIRRRYNELTYRINRKEVEASEERFDGDDSKVDYEITRANFNQRHEAFLAQCRDSDDHYALLQNSDAYAAVCSDDEAKQSVTCALF